MDVVIESAARLVAPYLDGRDRPLLLRQPPLLPRLGLFPLSLLLLCHRRCRCPPGCRLGVHPRSRSSSSSSSRRRGVRVRRRGEDADEGGLVRQAQLPQRLVVRKPHAAVGEAEILLAVFVWVVKWINGGLGGVIRERVGRFVPKGAEAGGVGRQDGGKEVGQDLVLQLVDLVCVCRDMGPNSKQWPVKRHTHHNQNPSSTDRHQGRGEHARAGAVGEGHVQAELGAPWDRARRRRRRRRCRRGHCCGGSCGSGLPPGLVLPRRDGDGAMSLVLLPQLLLEKDEGLVALVCVCVFGG